MDSPRRNDQASSLPQHSHFFLLPPELLHGIFSPLASRGPFELRHALFVCKRWYNIILNDQKLWSTITVDRDFVDRFELYHSASERAQISIADAYIRACLDRSAPFPLHITLDRPFENTDGRILDIEPCRLVLDRLLRFGEPRHIQRCKSLSWYIETTYFGTRVVPALLPQSLERLEYLFVNGFSHDSSFFTRFPQCPRLKEVHLVNHFEGTSPLYFLSRDFTHVEKLTYTSDIGWVDYDIPYIQKFNGIRTLVLEDVSPHFDLGYSHVDEVEDTSIAHLHSLETLKLIGSIPLDILQRLHAPILKRVDIATATDSYALQSQPLDIIPLALLQSVTSISICLTGSPTPPDPQHLRRIVCGAPSLIHLTGTPGIGELLAGEEWFKERNIVYDCL